ncbi:Dihydroneopterin aldolase [Commensalibacter sp. Nvir]|uniref:dihydroneopterin aldolase n=1 Tax=Commensalibacter sp. Nvir TaxID=3069817 RepID=UPI002D48065F|nr:Dihydroneopterin aldolase [Commensalibacter sp. Nvir]
MSFFSHWSYNYPLRRIFIRDLTLNARIGVYDYEQQQLQRLQLNISVGVKDQKKIGKDDLSRTVSYEDIVNQVTKIVAQTHFHLVETLAETLVEAIMTDTRIIVIRIRIEKLDIIREAKGVGVEIERWRDKKEQ